MPETGTKPPKAWEGLAALVCGVCVWLDAIAEAFTSRRANASLSLFSVVLFMLGTAFGVGYGISGLRRGDGKNRLCAALALVIIGVYLFPLVFVRLSMFLRHQVR